MLLRCRSHHAWPEALEEHCCGANATWCNHSNFGAISYAFWQKSGASVENCNTLETPARGVGHLFITIYAQNDHSDMR